MFGDRPVIVQVYTLVMVVPAAPGSLLGAFSDKRCSQIQSYSPLGTEVSGSGYTEQGNASKRNRHL